MQSSKIDDKVDHAELGRTLTPLPAENLRCTVDGCISDKAYKTKAALQ